MTYFAPIISASGLQIPAYQDIEDLLNLQFKQVFGQDSYLESDSQDFQFNAALALVLYQTLLTAQLAYNSRSPVTAIGAGLDGVAALVGISRKPAVNSTASLLITGTPFTVINNGVAADINGNAWDLPTTVTIGSGGTVTALAVCRTQGAITALVNQINQIASPTLGWASVTNTVAATPGQPAETDASLRTRYISSVANPSQAITTGILGGVLGLDNVVEAQLYENDGNTTLTSINGVPNPGGFPPHSITLVVSGGSNRDIASAIAARKTPGCYTNGDQSVTITDQYGVPSVIRFYRPTAIIINVELNIKALNGYSSAIGDLIKAALVNYLVALPAGQSVILSELWQAALSADTARFATFSLLSLQAAKQGNTLDNIDIPINFNQEATSTLANITLFAT